jgi:hypothetical protein
MILVGDPMQSVGYGSTSHESKPYCNSAWRTSINGLPPQAWSFQSVLKASALLRSYVIRAVPWYTVVLMRAAGYVSPTKSQRHFLFLLPSRYNLVALRHVFRQQCDPAFRLSLHHIRTGDPACARQVSGR